MAGKASQRIFATLPHVAIMGGGLAGLTAAYKLASARGIKVTVYEASDRLGGRVFTDEKPFPGRFCERGAEWIDTTHSEVLKLATKLGLKLQNVSAARRGEDLYYFGGEPHMESEFLYRGKGVFAPLAEQIEKDYEAAIKDPKTQAFFDQQSIDTYLASLQQKIQAPTWMIDGLKMAYKGEFGAETSELNALLFIQQISTSLDLPFEVYGPAQDESWRIQGGNSQLITALKAKCEELGVDIKTGQEWTKLDYNPDHFRPIKLAFADGTTQEHTHLITTLPLTKLRQVAGLDVLKERGLISAEKLKAIQEVGYGNMKKIIFSVRGKPFAGLLEGKQSNGSLRTELPFLQNTWVSSAAQQGEDTIFTVLVAGNEAKSPLQVIARGAMKSLSTLLGKPESELFDRQYALQDWQNAPYAQGSYTAPKPGQWSMLEVTGTPELSGRMGFAGEYADPEQFGYMNGAVRSALKESKRMINQIRNSGLEKRQSRGGTAVGL